MTVALRFPDVRWKADATPCQMQYKYSAKDRDAPEYANCVTAVRYLVEKSARRSLPPVWIGDMPRALIAYCGCTIVRGEPEPGDLLFLRNDDPAAEKTISHIMVALGGGKFFHCSWKRKGAATESSPPELLQRVIDNPAFLLRYIDPRNEKLRHRYGELLAFPIPRPIAINTS